MPWSTSTSVAASTQASGVSGVRSASAGRALARRGGADRLAGVAAAGIVAA